MAGTSTYIYLLLKTVISTKKGTSPPIKTSKCVQLWSLSRYKQFKYQHKHENGYTKEIEKYCLNGRIIQDLMSPISKV